MSLSNEERAELNQLKKELSELRKVTIGCLGDLARTTILSNRVSVQLKLGNTDDALEAAEKISAKIETLSDRLLDFIESDYGRNS